MALTAVSSTMQPWSWMLPLRCLKRIFCRPEIQLMDKKGAPADGGTPSYAAMTTAEGLRGGVSPPRGWLPAAKLPGG